MKLESSRHLCAACRERRAKFQYKGRVRVRADRQHVLCFQCYRSERERQRARQLALFPGMPAPRVASTLPASRIGHRRRMLRHLETLAASVAERKP